KRRLLSSPLSQYIIPPPPSFIQVVANNKKTTLLLYPKEGTDISIRKLLKEEVNPQKEGIRIAEVRVIRNKGLAVDCASEAHALKLLGKLEEKEKLRSVVEAKNSRKASRGVLYTMYLRTHQTRRWRSWISKNSKSAIICPTSNLRITCLTPQDNYVAIKILLKGKPCTTVSAYSSPLEDIEPTLMELQDISEALNNGQLIIGADLNGHYTSWGYNDTSPRGRAIEEFLKAKQLILLNTIDDPITFFRTNVTVGGPDLTFTSTNEIVERTS
ncbi:hypothetical protein AVEN_264016-2-1, partial [Araneus ventricosus]